MFTPKNFYSCGFLLLVVVLLWCMLLAMQCPYKAKCQYAYYVCLVTAVVAGTSGVIMGMIGYSIVHVDTLKEPDLTPHKMSTSTKRWGYVARTCPYVSRGLFVLAGMAAGGAIAAAHYTCPPVGDAQWENQWCSHTGKPPNPLQDFGVVAGLWLLVALCGNRIRSSTLLPFLFEAQSEDQGRKAVGCLNKMAHCIHA
mmetsp:Transcript_45811/g.122490  ORF Transcript_45811/g.122490 Transcript_45811/m.122490 type:complete len:197 (+) Transcript_45811:147-737(+)